MSCFWVTMAVFFAIGVATLPFGFAIWAVQLVILFKVLGRKE